MSKSNAPVEFTQKVITRSKAKQDNQLTKFVDQNQTESLKLKRSGKIKENLVDNKYKDISNAFPTDSPIFSRQYEFSPFNKEEITKQVDD